jgi:hypothetical protein
MKIYSVCTIENNTLQHYIDLEHGELELVTKFKRTHDEPWRTVANSWRTMANHGELKLNISRTYQLAAEYHTVGELQTTLLSVFVELNQPN